MDAWQYEPTESTRARFHVDFSDISSSEVSITCRSDKVLIRKNVLSEKQLSRKFYWIDKYMMLPKLCYLFHFAKHSYVTYILLFLTSIGLDPAQAGIVNSIRLIGLISGNFFWGIFADSKQAHRTILYFLSFFGAFFLTSQPFISAKFGPPSLNKCPIAVGNETICYNHKIKLSQHEHGLLSTTELMYFLALVCFLGAFFDGSIQSFIDAGVLKRIKACTFKRNFGKQRMFGSVGFGLGSIVHGVFFDVLKYQSLTCYISIFCVYMFFLICSLIVNQALYKEINISQCESSVSIDGKNYSFKEEFMITIRKPETILLFVTSLNSGIFLSVNGYTILYLKSLDASNMLIAIAMAVGSFSGSIVCALSGWLTKKLRGIWNTILFVTTCWTLRYLVLGFMTNPYYIIPIELFFNGTTISLYNVTSARSIKTTSQENVFTAVFSMNNALLYGVGTTIGNFIGGHLYKNYGAINMFKTMSVSTFIWACVVLAFICISHLKKTKRNSTFS